ncbi:hypothetical protein [Paracoccus sediminilitoris]|uniref:hypothetical protein n=1 Tax=Paracoccus sediminilitoris TaxID=2202419 RepID=UPI00272A4804|nr:hypothetical protein [Paracoccus sediminilitoris]
MSNPEKSHIATVDAVLKISALVAISTALLSTFNFYYPCRQAVGVTGVWGVFALAMFLLAIAIFAALERLRILYPHVFSGPSKIGMLTFVGLTGIMVYVYPPTVEILVARYQPAFLSDAANCHVDKENPQPTNISVADHVDR